MSESFIIVAIAAVDNTRDLSESAPRPTGSTPWAPAVDDSRDLSDLGNTDHGGRDLSDSGGYSSGGSDLSDSGSDYGGDGNNLDDDT